MAARLFCVSLSQGQVDVPRVRITHLSLRNVNVLSSIWKTQKEKQNRDSLSLLHFSIHPEYSGTVQSSVNAYSLTAVVVIQ